MPTSTMNFYPSGQTTDINVVPAITFSAGVSSGTVNFNIIDTNNNIVPTTINYNTGVFTYSLTPNVYLNYSTNYLGVFISGIDLSHNIIPSAQWPFYTNNYSTLRALSSLGCWIDDIL